MRKLAAVVLVAIGIFGIVDANRAARAQGSIEIDVHRNGSDYTNLQGVATPEECRQVCTREEQCVAWTHVKAGLQGPQARCWLKNAVPEPAAHSCCVSGVKLVAAQEKPAKELFEKYQLIGVFSADCAKPVSSDNLYFIHRPIDASTIQRDQMNGADKRDSYMIFNKAWEVRPNEIFLSGDFQGQPVELSWIIQNQRQLVMETTIGGKKIISGGKTLSTGTAGPWMSKCGEG